MRFNDPLLEAALKVVENARPRIGFDYEVPRKLMLELILEVARAVEADDSIDPKIGTSDGS